jgi:hypothetical protein
MMIGRPAVVRRRPLLRAAAIGGTYAAGRAAGRRAQENAAGASQGQPTSDLEAGQVPAQPTAGQFQAAPETAPPGSPGPGGGTTGEQGSHAGDTVPVLDQLSQLTAMHDQGALTDEEFAAAKAKVLGG